MTVTGRYLLPDHDILQAPAGGPHVTVDPDVLRRLADIVSGLRHMWDDLDGDTHLPVEESDDMCAAGTELARILGCTDQWPDIAAAVRALAGPADGAP